MQTSHINQSQDSVSPEYQFMYLKYQINCNTFSRKSTIVIPYRWTYTGYQSIKGVKYMMMEGDLTLGGEHKMQYTDDVL